MMDYKQHFFDKVPKLKVRGKVYFQMIAVCTIAGRDHTYLREMKPHMSDLQWHRSVSWVDFTDVRILLRDAGTDIAKKYYEALFGDSMEKIQTVLN